MNINLEHDKNKITLNVVLKFRGKHGTSKSFTNHDARFWIAENYPNLKIGNVISSPSKCLHNLNRLNGTWVFELQKEKHVDILDKSVKISETKKDIPSTHKTLPNGLKKIESKPKPKRKRAARKKKTEE